VTGSGETQATADRVQLYRVEGNIQKVERPPRKRVKISERDEGYTKKAQAVSGGKNFFFVLFWSFRVFLVVPWNLQGLVSLSSLSNVF
jgi:hypothetical protein